MRPRLGRWLAAAVLLAAATGYVVVNTSSHDPARWHVDPATVRLNGKPNEYLAAPRGTTADPADAETRLYPESPRALLARFDAIARAQTRTAVVAGDLDSLMITYVQRSRIGTYHPASKFTDTQYVICSAWLNPSRNASPNPIYYVGIDVGRTLAWESSQRGKSSP